MLRKVALQVPDRSPTARFKHRHLTEHAAGCGDPGKPGAAGKVIAARQHRRRGRDQARADPNGGSFLQPGQIPVEVEIEPDLDRPPAFRIAGRECQPDPVIRRLFLSRQHLAVDRGDHRPDDRLCPDQRRLCPDQGTTRRHRQPRHCRGPTQEGKTSVGRQQGQRSTCQPGPGDDYRQPLPGVRSCKPGGNSGGKGHDGPGPLFDPGSAKELLDSIKPAGQVEALAPRAMLQCSAVRRLTVHGHLGQGFTGHGGKRQEGT